MLTALDIIVLVLIGGGLVMGVLRGFVSEALSLFAWFAAVFVLKLLFGPARDLLTGVIGTYYGASVLAFVIVFGATFFAGKLVAGAIGRRTRRSVLGPLDRLLGAGFGMLKGLLVATVGFLVVSLVSDMGWARPSRTYPLLNASGKAVLGFVERRRARHDAGANASDAAPERAR